MLDTVSLLHSHHPVHRLNLLTTTFSWVTFAWLGGKFEPNPLIGFKDHSEKQVKDLSCFKKGGKIRFEGY